MQVQGQKKTLCEIIILQYVFEWTISDCSIAVFCVNMASLVQILVVE